MNSLITGSLTGSMMVPSSVYMTAGFSEKTPNKKNPAGVLSEMYSIGLTEVSANGARRSSAKVIAAAQERKLLTLQLDEKSGGHIIIKELIREH